MVDFPALVNDAKPLVGWRRGRNAWFDARWLGSSFDPA